MRCAMNTRFEGEGLELRESKPGTSGKYPRYIRGSTPPGTSGVSTPGTSGVIRNWTL